MILVGDRVLVTKSNHKWGMKLFPQVNLRGMKMSMNVNLRGTKFSLTKIRCMKFCTEKITGRKKIPTSQKKCSRQVVYWINVPPLNKIMNKMIFCGRMYSHHHLIIRATSVVVKYLRSLMVVMKIKKLTRSFKIEYFFYSTGDIFC